MNFEKPVSKKELSTKEKEYQKILEAEGLVYLGVQENENNDYILFKTGNSYGWDNGMMILIKDFNVENIRKKIKETEKKYLKTE